MDTFIFSGLLWPPQPRRSDGKPQILMWILMWKKGKNLVYLYVKLSILSIGGPRLIFMNSNKCPTMWLIKKWDVALSSRFVWRYSFSQLSIRNLGYLMICYIYIYTKTNKIVVKGGQGLALRWHGRKLLLKSKYSSSQETRRVVIRLFLQYLPLFWPIWQSRAAVGGPPI